MQTRPDTDSTMPNNKEIHLQLPKKENVLRIYSQNIHSLCITNMIEMQQIMHKIERAKDDVILLQETDVNSQISQNYHDIKSTMNYQWNTSTLQIASTPTKSQRRNFKGGAATIVQGMMTGKIQEKYEDKYGRWTCTELYPSKRPPMVIINAYIPCTNATPGPQTYQMGIAYAHPNICHSSEVIQETWHDLAICVTRYKNEKFEVIIGIDANSNCNDQNSNIGHFLNETDMSACYSIFHPESTVSSTEMGTARIDTFIISPSLVPAIQTIHFLPYDAIVDSDHHGIILEISTDNLFTPRKHDATSIHHRRLVMSRPKVVQKYTDTLRKSIKYYKIKENIQAIKTDLSKEVTPEHIKRFDNIANQMKEIQINAEKVFKGPTNVPMVTYIM